MTDAVWWFYLLWFPKFMNERFDVDIKTIGLTMIAMLFVGGFLTIGGEWFQMWRSSDWNGSDAAFRNAVVALFALLVIHLPAATDAHAGDG